jgi:serine phosphatase RsbU (regulator of sigma subunit)/anti-sigma regulatory factor (Ser/Thr protein kinase)
MPIRIPDEAEPRERILVVLANAENRRLLADVLRPRYDVVEEVPWRNSAGEGAPIDLCIVDGLSLHRHWDRLAAERRAHEPVLLPVLLLADRKDVGLTTRAAWQVVDDVLLRPVERLEMQARVESLLRARRLSLRLRRVSALYDAERRITERLQEAALPRTLPQIPGMALDAYYRAGMDDARIGGDWYDALRLADGRIVISIGDVSGSGLDAAVTMSNVRQVLRGVAHVHPDPAMMLDAADRTLQSEEPDRLVTAFVAVLDPVTDELTYASAGHPRPLLRRGDGRWTELVAPGIPLGAPSKGTRVTETTTMSADAVLVLYTDGLTEATRDIAAGEAALRAAVSDPGVIAAPNVSQAIHDAVIEGTARDDVAIFTVRRSGDADRQAIAHWAFETTDAATARRTRREVSTALLQHGLSKEALGAAELVFAELLGNVVRYAPGPVHVALDCGGLAPVLHVLDAGRGFRHLPKLPDDVLSERGRGLYIVSAFSDDFTVTRRPHGGSHARAVLSLSVPVIPPFGAMLAFGDLDTIPT